MLTTRWRGRKILFREQKRNCSVCIFFPFCGRVRRWIYTFRQREKAVGRMYTYGISYMVHWPFSFASIRFFIYSGIFFFTHHFIFVCKYVYIETRTVAVNLFWFLRSYQLTFIYTDSKSRRMYGCKFFWAKKSEEVVGKEKSGMALAWLASYCPIFKWESIACRKLKITIHFHSLVYIIGVFRIKLWWSQCFMEHMYFDRRLIALHILSTESAVRIPTHNSDFIYLRNCQQ